MNDARHTVLDRCFALAEGAGAKSWTFHNAKEALFWFNSALKVDPRNTRACLGAAQAYQYIASQPWWHNDLAYAKTAANKALAVAERASRSNNLVDRRTRELILGQIRSAIGQVDLAQRHFDEAITLDEQYPVGFYFRSFNRMFIEPREDIILPGLDKAVALAEAEGSQRRLAVALYFRGFANTLFAKHEDAIDDLTQSMELSPGYGSANLALIAATALRRHPETYRVVRCFKERYPHFDSDLLDYMWVERSPSAKYRRYVRPMTALVRAKLAA